LTEERRVLRRDIAAVPQEETSALPDIAALVESFVIRFETCMTLTVRVAG
jgi:hypothetical protein